jgi:hypothetical protein
MSKKSEVAYAKGFLDGLIDGSWKCYDCENIYESTVEECPNKKIDQANASYRSAKYRNSF